MLSLSPSKIKAYILCPFKYKCDSNNEIRKCYHIDTPALTFGQLIHATLNDLYKRTPKEQRSYDKLREIFKTKYIAHRAKHDKIFRTKEVTIEYVERAKKMFKYFADSEYFSREPYATEEYPKYQLNDSLELSGKYDRLDLINNQLILVDYKTGALRDEEQEPFQLDFYELLLKYIEPNYPVADKIYYYLDENKIINIPSRHDELTNIEKQITDIADRIAVDGLLAPKENKKCKYCNYLSICPIFKKDG